MRRRRRIAEKTIRTGGTPPPSLPIYTVSGGLGVVRRMPYNDPQQNKKAVAAAFLVFSRAREKGMFLRCQV